MLDDLDLFLKVNDEYASKPLVPAPQVYDPETLKALGRKRVADMDARVGIRGKRVLEVGCGHGETARALATELGCVVTAIDINPSLKERWAEYDDAGVDFRAIDVTREDTANLGKFDFIFSNAMLEHCVHPFALLKALKPLMAPGGRMHFNMGLHRGPMGSHMYREVFFPWPHLVFTESTFERFYKHIGKPAQRPVWISHVTATQWLEMFDVLGLHPHTMWYYVRPLDREFYNRFEDILNRYPIYDLERDLMYVDLVDPQEHELLGLVDVPHASGTTLKQKRLDYLASEVRRLDQLAATQLKEIEELKAAPSALKALTADLQESLARLHELQELAVQTPAMFTAVAADLQQKVSRLQLIEERFNKDLRGVRKLGRAVTRTGSTLLGLIQPPVSAVRAAVSRAKVRPRAEPAKLDGADKSNGGQSG